MIPSLIYKVIYAYYFLNKKETTAGYLCRKKIYYFITTLL